MIEAKHIVIEDGRDCLVITTPDDSSWVLTGDNVQFSPDQNAPMYEVVFVEGVPEFREVGDDNQTVLDGGLTGVELDAIEPDDEPQIAARQPGPRAPLFSEAASKVNGVLLSATHPLSVWQVYQLIKKRYGGSHTFSFLRMVLETLANEGEIREWAPGEWKGINGKKVYRYGPKETIYDGE
jgi:hypothetical protein